MPVKILRFGNLNRELYQDIALLLRNGTEPNYYLSLEESYHQLGISVTIKSQKVYQLWNTNKQMVIESILCAYDDLRTISPSSLRINSLPITEIEVFPEVIL